MVDDIALRRNGTGGSLTTLNEVEIEAQLFELAQRKAKIYANSGLVPQEYRGNIGNVLIAQNMAKRMQADVLSVMQNLFVVHGRPGWSAQFLVACFNSCGRFSSIKYRFVGERGKDNWGCIAYATEKETNEVLEGSTVDIKMAKDEGWYGKKGSKWQTMPEQMLRYRAAAFFIRAVAPDIGLGMMTREELTDIRETSQRTVSPIRELLDKKESTEEVDEVEGEATEVEEPEGFSADEFESQVMEMESATDIDNLINDWCLRYPELEKEIVEIGVARRDLIEAENAG